VKPLVTPRLIIRNWEERDRDLFFLINSDDRVMEFFPFRRDRAQSDQLLDLLRNEIDEYGFGLAALELRESGQCIGFCGLRHADIGPVLPPHAVEIGWRLAPQHWGRGYVTEAAGRWLEEGFGPVGLSEIVSFAVWNNRRSTAVMERIGMHRDPAGDFDHPRVPDTHAALRRHVLYWLTKADWENARAAR